MGSIKDLGSISKRVDLNEGLFASLSPTASQRVPSFEGVEDSRIRVLH